MNRIAIACLFALSAAAAGAQASAVGAPGSEPATPPEENTAPAVIDTTAGAGKEENVIIRAGDIAKTRRAEDTGCVRSTGSLLRRADRNGCNGLPGRSYTRDELGLTGGMTLGESLKRMDAGL